VFCSITNQVFISHSAERRPTSNQTTVGYIFCALKVLPTSVAVIKSRLKFDVSTKGSYGLIRHR